MLQSSNWDHSVHHVHYIVVSILFLIKFSKSLGQLGHCCKPEKLQQLIAAVRALKNVKFPEQASIHKIKAAITEIITFKSSSALHFSSNSQTTELAVINNPNCSNLQQPLYSCMFHCLLHTATPNSITNYHLLLQPKHLSCNMRLRGSKRHDKLEF